MFTGIVEDVSMRLAVFASLAWFVISTHAMAQDRMPPIAPDQVVGQQRGLRRTGFGLPVVAPLLLARGSRCREIFAAQLVERAAA